MVRLAAEGLSNRQIAAHLIVSENTVKAHLHHAATTLDAANRTALVHRARDLRLLGEPELSRERAPERPALPAAVGDA